MFDFDLSILPVGGTFVLNGVSYTVVKHTKNAIYMDVDGKRKKYSPLNKSWGQFCRDIEGLVIGSRHGVDAGCLTVLYDDWVRRGSP